MREETVLMEHIKDQVCFVSQDVRRDLAASRKKESPFRCEYVLPDGLNSGRGFLRSAEIESSQAGVHSSLDNSLQLSSLISIRMK